VTVGQTGKAALSVSIAVPTRNRPAQIDGCVRTILALDGFADLIVVDQSDGDDTAKLMATIADSRLRYIRSETRGVTNGRNIAIHESGSDIVAFTDDDCRVHADWVPQIVRLFSEDEDVAVVCGRVIVPEEIRNTGYAEAFEPHVRTWLRRYPPLGRDWGITANFSIRRTAIARVGDFDPFLGAGAPLKSGGEPDFLFRVLRAGYKVLNAEEVVVDHYGIRKPGEEFRKLILGYGYGTGAAMFKHVRLADVDGTLVYARFLGSAVGMVIRNGLTGRRPSGANYLKAFVAGSLGSFKYRVDRSTRQYRPRA
jgi:glycosyltransferase involved in cell wall biosynthesis